MSEDIRFESATDELSDEALDLQRERYCMGSCGCKVDRLDSMAR